MDQNILLIGLLVLSQMSKMTIFAAIVAIILFVPGVKDKVTHILNNGYSRVHRISNQISSPRDAQNSPDSSGSVGGEGKETYREQQFQASTKSLGSSTGLSPSPAR